MLRYVNTLMRNEPGTFIVAIVLIAILAFGAWDFLSVTKR
jgi:hypothetical protein